MASGSLLSASAEAALRASWPKPLTSPFRWITAMPGSWRTVASRCLAAIVASFQVHYHLDGVVGFIAGDVHLVDHVLDQEQPPAPGRLQTLQLGLQVRHLLVGLGNRTPTLVSDTHRQVRLRREHLDLDGHLRFVLVAVLHGVHRRLGHGGLEPLQALSLKTHVLYHVGNHFHGPPLVTGLTGHGKLGQGSPEFGIRPCGFGVGHAFSDLSRVTRVISSSCSQPSPTKRANSSSRKSIIVAPPGCAPTNPCSLGKPNISRWGSWASTRPSL